MTHELSRYWDQPARESVLVDATHAVMTRAVYLAIPEYLHSEPSGVYTGKMWRLAPAGRLLLAWYEVDGDRVWVRVRRVLFVETGAES